MWEADYTSVTETRCGQEYIVWNNHAQPTIETCTLPWWHEGEHESEHAGAARAPGE